jgi:hypothetical protein
MFVKTATNPGLVQNLNRHIEEMDLNSGHSSLTGYICRRTHQYGYYKRHGTS